MALRAWTRVTGSADNSNYEGGFEWQVTNTDADRIANNRSVLRVRMWAKKKSGNGAYNFTDKTSNINIAGSSYDQTTRYDYRNASTNVIYYVGYDTSVFPKGAYKDVTITHNADGTKQVSISTHLEGGDTSVGDFDTSATITLPTIPRASQPSAPNGTFGSPILISTNRVSDSFTHVLKAYVGYDTTIGEFTDVIATEVGASFNWTPPLAWQENMTSSQSGDCIITCETYSGGTYIGTKTVTITLSVDTASCSPELTGEYKDVNADIVAITGDDTLLISSLSNAQITALPVLKYGATISSIKIDGTDVTTAGEPYNRTINGIEAESILLELTDSRGFVKEYNLILDYNPYTPITFLASFFRTASASNEVALQFSGTFYNDNIGETANTISVRYRYQPELGEWSNWIDVDVVVDGDEFSNEGLQVSLGSIFSRNSQYMFEIEFIDALDVKTNTIIVRTARTVLKVTENCQVLQGKLHIQKLYTKNDKDFVFDFVYDVITRTWLVHVYGLTQMFEPQHIFQADVNARSIITVLNKDGYPLLKYTMDDTANNFKDYVNVDELARYNNYTMVDTGISPLSDILEKRARELQFTTYSTGVDELEFFVSAYIDSRNISNPDATYIDWISDPDDPDYGKLYSVEEEVANVYGETNLDSWIIDQSRFPKIGLIRSHLQLHGKGLYYRAIIINRDMIEHELSGIAWIYRVMNAR